MQSSSVFQELEHDFLHYMLEYGGIAKKTSHDYVSRMRFLSRFYVLDTSVTAEYVEYILNEEQKVYSHRDSYNTPKALGDLRAGLNKFLSFVKSGYLQRKKDTILSEIDKVEQNAQLSLTERTQIIQSRVGQGQFRKQLVDYWNGCSVSGCAMFPILVASHIMPWYVSDNVQRIDVYNGLLLQPNIDKLFDRGYISFDMRGGMQFSRLFGKVDRKLLGMDSSLHLSRIEDAHRKYLAYHQENCFLG